MGIHKLESNVGGKLDAKRAAAALARPASRAPSRRVTFGIIVGNRGFFPGHSARTGLDEFLKALK